MKIRFTVFISLNIVLLVSLSSSAQTLTQLIKAGDKKYEEADYYAASLYYKDALKKDENDVALLYKFAEASRMFNDYAGAAEAYDKVVKLDKSNEHVLALFWLGEMLRSACVCKTEDAIKVLRRFKSRYHKKDYYSAKVDQEIQSCGWVLDHLKPDDSIHIEHLGTDVNTENSEFNAIYVAPDKIQYSALRNISDDKKNETYLVRIYNQAPNPEKIFMPEGANPAMNIGNGAYSPDFKQFYFTECEPRDKVNMRCDIYVSKYENYKWMPAEKLDAVNEPGATNTHPAIGYDSKGNEVLFFASDRSGGQGGLDLWSSILNKDGSYSAPVNLGSKVNTPGNEVTPFYDINSKKLFFSSDWHYGFGGYDIFETMGENTTWSEPKNLMQPINSAQNDLYYSIAFDNSKAFITSNRTGSYFIKAETCCNDIYAYSTGKTIEKKMIDTVSVAVNNPVPEIKESKHDTIVNMPVISTAESNPVEPKSPQEIVKKMILDLPVRLYFDNDEPDCCNLRDTTSLDYKETYESYSALALTYRKEFAKGLKGDEKAAAEKEIDNLFTGKVDKGFYALVAFTSQLYDLLKDGNKLEITIKGYCSPLNYSEYNIKLGYRRVASLRNYFYHYRNDILLPYIDSGSLVLKNESFGKETAPKDVSDNLQDIRNSVYNPKAAAERRVEIISVDLK